jgi:NADPH:quinone reductase-like Zn-dependent oxidoreductase
VRALVLEEAAGPGGAVVREVDDPAPGPGEVAVRVEAAGLNHLDLLLARGRVGVRVDLPHVPGAEAAGAVAAVGEGVDPEGIGEQVTVYPYVGCGRCRFCLLGEEQVCPVGQARCVGLGLPGTFAELVVVPAQNAVSRPPGLSAVDAAAVSMTGMTAYRLVVGHGRPRPGETVLLRAVGSGVGVMALQLAKLSGTTVIGTAGTDEKLERAAKMGMDEGINHSEEDVPARVKELTGGNGVDLVVDYVGAATWADNLRSLGRGGRLVLCGAHVGTKAEVDLWHLFAKEHTVMGSYGGTRDDLRRALALAAEGRLLAVVDAVLPLDQAREGLERMESRSHIGKIVLSVDGS